MLYAGLDLSRKRLDFHLLDSEGETVEVGATPPDADGLRGLAERFDRHHAPIRAAIESMNGARFVHDRLELAGWQVEIADAQKVKGLAPLACSADEPVSFETHIKPMFRERDQQAMQRAFDLWSHDDVSRHADAILAQLQAGTMPCDGAWPEAQVDLFRRWAESGKPS